MFFNLTNLTTTTNILGGVTSDKDKAIQAATNKPTTIALPLYNVVSLSLLVAILIIGVFGNSLIIYVFGYKKRRQIKRFENFLLLLAVVDLIASFVIPMSFFYLTATDFKRWDFGETGCHIIPSLLQMSITVSHGVLILISYERYHNLVKPFNSRIGKHFIVAWLFFVVVLSVGLVSPYMMTLTVQKFEMYNIQTCMPDAGRTDLVMLSSSLQVIRDFLAIGIMALLNQRMTHALTKQQDYINWKRDKMSQKGRKLLRLIIIIFSGLTLPVDLFQMAVYSIVSARVSLSPSTFEAVSHINTFLNILQTSNSMVNIFIYSRMHDMFQLEWCKSSLTTVRRKFTFSGGAQMSTEKECSSNKGDLSAETSCHSRNSSNLIHYS